MDQIQREHPNINKITIHGGRKNQSSENWNNPTELDQYHWDVSEAYIMYISDDLRIDKEDIGIAIVPKWKGFFDRNYLSIDRQNVLHAKIVPIRLGKKEH